MRYQLDVMENQIIKSKTGSPKDNWVGVAQVRAFIAPLTMLELFRSGATGLDGVSHIATHRINIRFNQLVDTTKRFYYFDQVLNTGRWFIIVSVVDVENRHTQLVCTVKEEVYNGGN